MRLNSSFLLSQFSVNVITAQSCWFSSKQTWFCCCSGGKFLFSFQVPSIYPHEPPKVKCKIKVQLFSLVFYSHIFWHAPEKRILISFLRELQVYHPNIDLEGNVCLNVLREDWKPVLNINTIIYGLCLLFTVLYSSLQHLSLSQIYKTVIVSPFYTCAGTKPWGSP